MPARKAILAFEGDSTDLERTFTKVGAGAREMAGDFDKASGQAKSLDGAMGKVGGTVDASESKFMGTADVLDGLATTMGLNIDGQIAMARGFGDIAGGLTSLGPLLSGLAAKLGITSVATWAWNAAQTALNFVLSMNPIGLVVIALAALAVGFVLAWKHSETFRDVVRGAMDTVGGWVSWVLDRFGDLWAFIRSLPGKISGLGQQMVEIITWPYRTAFNAISGIWNNTVGRLHFEIPSWVPGLGGKGFDMPNLPTFHMGGTVPGNPGQAVPILAMAGETVSRAGAGGGATNVTIVVPGLVGSEDALARKIQSLLLQLQNRTGPLGLATT
jgi:hypothetical protein